MGLQKKFISRSFARQKLSYNAMVNKVLACLKLYWDVFVGLSSGETMGVISSFLRKTEKQVQKNCQWYSYFQKLFQV